MEILCGQCGSIGIGFDRQGAEEEARRHIEGWTHPKHPRFSVKAHPGHAVEIRPERLGALGAAFAMRTRIVPRGDVR